MRTSFDETAGKDGRHVSGNGVLTYVSSFMLTSASLSMAHYKSLHLSCPVESEEARGGIDGRGKRTPSRSGRTKVGAAETVSARARFKRRGERYLRVKVVIACRKQRIYRPRRVSEPAKWQLVVIHRRG